MVHHHHHHQQQHEHGRKRQRQRGLFSTMSSSVTTTTLPIIIVIIIAITSTVSVTAQKSTPSYYPNWSGGTNNCLLDCAPSSPSPNCTPRPEYMDTSNNLMKSTLKECCTSYYWWDLNVCLSSYGNTNNNLNGDTNGGSEVWYADYINFKCLLKNNNNQVSITGNVNVDNDIETFTSAEKCCKDQFPYLALGMCLSHSNGELVYKGSKKFYVDYTNGRYVLCSILCKFEECGWEDIHTSHLTTFLFCTPPSRISTLSLPFFLNLTDVDKIVHRPTRTIPTRGYVRV